MATATRARKTTAAPAKTAPPAAPAVPVLNFLDGLEDAVIDTSKPTVNLATIPDALKLRVDAAYVDVTDAWRRQNTTSQEQTDAVIDGMRTYAENRPNGRVTLRVKPLVEGHGFRYKVVEFVARPRS